MSCILTRDEAIDYVLHNRGTVYTCDEICEEGEFFGITTDRLGALCYTNFEIIEDINELPEGDWYEITDDENSSMNEEDCFERYWEKDDDDF